MRRFILIIFAATFLGALAWGLFVEPYRIEVTHTYIEGQVARPLKIAHLTDLHTAGLGRREKLLLELLDEEKPDVIIITGDTLTTGFHYDRIKPLLSRLHAPLGVWLVRGNWENADVFRGERAFYTQLGIRFLLNEAGPIRPDVWLAGLDDPSTGTANLDEALSSLPKNTDTILAFHAPGYFDDIAGRVPLVLAGHTHGGQFRLPGLPVFWLPRGSGHYLEGWYEDNGSRMYVSRGIGTSTLPIRFLCRPELAIITIGP
jgi:predicted MPP superfamily phosphohydrolase